MLTSMEVIHGHGWNLVRNSKAPGVFLLPVALTVTLAFQDNEIAMIHAMKNVITRILFGKFL